ncbi:hypothetical protein J6590_034822 [Homalodisca vitripennis]|nr:hypothetical protein J6590_034822 [Homalodisca vitripennis]
MDAEPRTIRRATATGTGRPTHRRLRQKDIVIRIGPPLPRPHYHDLGLDVATASYRRYLPLHLVCISSGILRHWIHQIVSFTEEPNKEKYVILDPQQSKVRREVRVYGGTAGPCGAAG